MEKHLGIYKSAFFAYKFGNFPNDNCSDDNNDDDKYDHTDGDDDDDDDDDVGHDDDDNTLHLNSKHQRACLVKQPIF